MRTNPRFTLKATVAATLCALAAVPPALADGATSSDTPQTIETMVVTAQKREQMAIDVPASVSAVSAERLANSGFSRLEDYAATIPGMSLTTLSRGSTSVVLRGISTGISSPTPATAFYIDEMPIGSINAYAVGNTLTPDLDPFDLRRVEVLKGPQGTLYGAGAVGGLVRYVTVAPDPNRFSGAIALGANTVSGGGNGYEARAAVNIPLAEKTVALRISGLDREEAGYIDNPILGTSDVNKAKTHGGRIALGWAINNDWTLDASAIVNRFSTGGIGAQNVTAPAMTPVTRELERGTYVPENQTRDLDVYNATLKGNMGGFSLVSSTTYQEVDASTTVDQSLIFGTLFSLPPPLGLGIPGIGAQTTQLVNTKRWSEELRARSTAFGDRLEYEIGYFYTKEDSSNSLPPLDPFRTATGAPFPVGIPIADAKILSKYKENSFFGNATYAITPTFDVMGGLRFSRDEQDYTQDYKKALLSPVPVLIVQSVTQDKTTYMAAARFKPDADNMFYGRVANGYRPGGPSALPPGIVPGGKQSFDPDTFTSVEVGYKSVFAGGMASIETAVFTTDWKDVQIQTSSTTAAGTYQYFVNGGTARSKGAELTLLVFPVQGLTLRATAAYTDSRLSEDAPAAGGVDGDRMPFVPKETASFGADYNFTVGGGMKAWIGGTVAYVGERLSNFSKKNPFTVDSYSTVAINTGIDINKNWRISVWGKNLTDERGVNFLNGIGLALPGLNPLGNPYAQGVIQPRTFGSDVTYRF